MSLDVEGAEEAVLANFAFERYTFKVLTIERPSDALRANMRGHDYVYVCDNGAWGDELWLHRTQLSQLPEDMRHLVPPGAGGALQSRARRCP